jgi:hypothetical protein
MGRIVLAVAIPVQLKPIVADGLHIVQGGRATGMAGHLQPLDRCELPENLAAQLFGFGLQLANLLRSINVVFFSQGPNLLDALLESGNRLLELQQQAVARLAHTVLAKPRESAQRWEVRL